MKERASELKFLPPMPTVINPETMATWWDQVRRVLERAVEEAVDDAVAQAVEKIQEDQSP